MNNHLKKEVIMSYFLLKTCRKCSLALIFMLLLQSTQAQHDFTGLNAILTKNAKTFGKEYVVVVNKEGKNIFLKESEEFKLKIPAPIGNSSKWLTVALVMIFVDEGKIKLDDQVSKYLPVYEKYMKGYITIRNCLSETTGVEGDANGILKVAQKNKFQSLEEEVNNYAAKRLIVDNPGTHFSYSSVGLNIAGRILEVITKKTFDRIAQEKLFRPLGMKTSTFYSENGGVNPSGGATCSAFDYINFMQMIMNKGMFNNKKVLSENAISEMLKNQFPDAEKRSSPELLAGFTYGMGCWIQEENANGTPNIISAPGFSGTWPWIDFSKKYAAIIFEKNTLTPQRKDLYMQIKNSIEEGVK